MPRRKDNEIYSYKLKSGKTKFGFKTYVGINQETGKPVKVTRQGFATRKEAEQAKTKIKAGGAGKVASKQNKQRKTVNDVWQEFSATQKLSIRPSSLLRTKNLYKKIEAEFANAYIDSINVDHLQKWTDSCARNYVEYKPIVNLFRKLIKTAIFKGWAESNPFDRVIIPKSGKKSATDSKDNYLEANDLEKFLATAKEINSKIYVFMIITVSLGLRRGEAFALQWKDLDFKNKLAHIRRTVTMTSTGAKSIGPTKTSDKYRRIDGVPMSDKLVSVLKDYHKHANDSKFIICNRKGDYYNTSMASIWLGKIYEKQPRLKRITTHGLRHTLASLLFETNSNITPQAVQYMLGHKDVKTTLDIYTSVTKKQKENLKRSVNDLKL
ncbi:site-specific integrase [Lactobacillus crispatus]|uniref:site-specific integrase n=1 Tax=Lactobacillus crispatus TaxID=47770 RepID=UPI0025519152|nr:site-specific integrase [Lactobacillus crispatus]MDK6376722.1 tyrosine-type recombinase/integrase [Lactobacillus crispatus]